MSIRKTQTLVCITPQGNSMRLIDRGVANSKELEGETHILYVQKGTDIFAWDEAPTLLQSLFDYGKKKDCELHAICGMDIAKTIQTFVRTYEITHIVLGEPLKTIAEKSKIAEDVINKLTNALPYVQFIILQRE